MTGNLGWATAPLVMLALSLATLATPARADILGSVVNSVLGVILNDTLNQPSTTAPDKRDIPGVASTGVLWPPNGRLTAINGQQARLSPGCQIRDHNNRIIMPGTIRAPIRVRYVRNSNHEIHRVWILGRADSAPVETSASN